LILRKIIKIVTTRCHIFSLKCTKFDFGWGSAPDPAGGTYSAPRPSNRISGVLLLRGKGVWAGREKRGGKGGDPPQRFAVMTPLDVS